VEPRVAPAEEAPSESAARCAGAPGAKARRTHAGVASATGAKVRRTHAGAAGLAGRAEPASPPQAAGARRGGAGAESLSTEEGPGPDAFELASCSHAARSCGFAREGPSATFSSDGIQRVTRVSPVTRLRAAKNRNEHCNNGDPDRPRLTARHNAMLSTRYSLRVGTRRGERC
jgi:hypothetical protein